MNDKELRAHCKENKGVLITVIVHHADTVDPVGVRLEVTELAYGHWRTGKYPSAVRTMIENGMRQIDDQIQKQTIEIAHVLPSNPPLVG